MRKREKYYIFFKYSVFFKNIIVHLFENIIIRLSINHYLFDF